nr:HAD family hydrolase [Gemmatimonadota bacterium]NIR79248.1 HAD family hydrolase [Gemmatimonadota bacterium]NIT86290.1 HAD family hydrolase [Gemmatimonadota bacterium]NIU31768.1 HAD family hydrolase [Gemmatimonadota bacterium]NIU35067.1 HAD-IA family hydrolase [Gemmatimonadota bacterium]
ERFGFPAGAARELRDDFEEHFPERCVPFPGLASTLRALAAAGLVLGLVTNGRVLIQSRKIDGLGIRSFFDSIVISEAAGCRKPDPRIFEIALTELAVAPGAAVFVGDHPVADMEGARRAGLISIWKRDDFWPEPDDVVGVAEDLAQLPDVLFRLEGAGRTVEGGGGS